MRYGDEIEAFMRQLAAGDRIFVWLTDAYLRSPYCIYELHEIWRQSGQDGAAFDQRVTVVLGDAKIRHETELKQYSQFRRRERDAVYDRIREAENKVQVAKDAEVLGRIVRTTDAILVYIRDRIRHPDFAALSREEFGQD